MAQIRAAGAKLFFLPPYSPDLNPIKQAFAKLKRIGALLNCFTPQECANNFANAVYAST